MFATARPSIEAWYDAGFPIIGAIWYAWKRNANLAYTDTNWDWEVFGLSDDVAFELRDARQDAEDEPRHRLAPGPHVEALRCR